MQDSGLRGKEPVLGLNTRGGRVNGFLAKDAKEGRGILLAVKLVIEAGTGRNGARKRVRLILGVRQS